MLKVTNNMLSQMNPVLNTDTKRIVMLPLSDKVVIEQGFIVHQLSCNIAGIDDVSYQVLVERLGLPVTDVNKVTSNYFVDRCIAVECDNKPVVSRKGYGLVFDILSQGMDIKSMLEDLDGIVLDWEEENTEQVLARIGYSPLSDDDTELAIDIIKSMLVTDATVTSYKNEDKTMILWER